MEQKSTFLRNFDFCAIHSAQIPELTITISKAPLEGLKNSIQLLTQDIFSKWGLKSEVTSEKETNLLEGTPAIEGGVDMESFDGVNWITLLVLNAIHGGKIVSVRLSSLSFKYENTMKKMLREIAYSLSFK